MSPNLFLFTKRQKEERLHGILCPYSVSEETQNKRGTKSQLKSNVLCQEKYEYSSVKNIRSALCVDLGDLVAAGSRLAVCI